MESRSGVHEPPADLAERLPTLVNGLDVPPQTS
jgi:hypothetical protein